jgi:hypothetical protein
MALHRTVEPVNPCLDDRYSTFGSPRPSPIPLGRPIDGKEVGVTHTLKQAWWAPLAIVLALAQLWVGLAFFYGDGTSNVLDAESTVAGAGLAFGGAAALVAGLWIRPQGRGLGNALVVIGAALGSIWLWTVVMTPLAIVVIVGVVVSQVRATAPGGTRL